jgi:hypothetical protein
MVARVRGRLSYANVVATLALFVALGGTGYAASQLTGRDIKNRSISRVDIKKNALTGTEINESKLAQVPSAALSLNAINANSALAADVSKNSQSADTAAVAGIANDARALAGQGAATFEKSSRTQFGRAAVNPAGVSSEQTLLSWPELGVSMTTTNQGACAVTELGLRFVNTKASGPGAQVFENGTGQSGAAVSAGASRVVCSHSSTAPEFHGEITDSTGKTLFFDCFAGNGQTHCLGVRSEA